MSPSPVPQVRLSIVAAFPKNYFLENLAIRADNLMAYDVPSSASVYSVDVNFSFACSHRVVE